MMQCRMLVRGIDAADVTASGSMHDLLNVVPQERGCVDFPRNGATICCLHALRNVLLEMRSEVWILAKPFLAATALVMSCAIWSLNALKPVASSVSCFAFQAGLMALQMCRHSAFPPFAALQASARKLLSGSVCAREGDEKH